MCFKTLHLSISLSHNFLSLIPEHYPHLMHSVWIFVLILVYNCPYLMHSVWPFVLITEPKRTWPNPAFTCPHSHPIAPCTTAPASWGAALPCWDEDLWGLGSWLPQMGRVELRGKTAWVKHLAEAEMSFFLGYRVRVQGSQVIDWNAVSSGCGHSLLMASLQSWTAVFSTLGSWRNLEALRFCAK